MHVDHHSFSLPPNETIIFFKAKLKSYFFLEDFIDYSSLFWILQYLHIHAIKHSRYWNFI